MTMKKYTSEMGMESNQLTFVLNNKDGDTFLDDTFAQTYLNGKRLNGVTSLDCKPVRHRVEISFFSLRFSGRKSE